MGEGKQKIAVLGGGMGSLTTVFELTNVPDWQDKFDITVYQLGWRLGGKGASGRAEKFRIEEHGLHVWMGFYDNSFRVIQAAYKELGRTPGSPLATWEDAFKKHSFIVVDEHIKGEWKDWCQEFPTNNLVPGQGGDLPNLDEGIKLLFGYLREHLRNMQASYPATLVSAHPHPGVFGELMDDAEKIVAATGMAAGSALLFLAEDLVDNIQGKCKPVSALCDVLVKFLGWLWRMIEACLDGDDELRRLWIMADILVATTIGLIEEHVLFGSYDLDPLDKYDFREFLKKYGASAMSYNSGAIQGLYDLVFGYIGGDSNNPNFGAGASIRSAFRIGLTYKGAVFYKMQAGMGDTIFTPLYDVLKKRGVNFEFFHRVRNLGLSVDKKSIESIRVSRQVTLKNGSYDPLIDCLNLPCWPSDPIYDQIVEGEQLKAEGINLESFWTPWKDVEEFDLQLGRDFDQVVLGISIGAFPYIAPELSEASTKWKSMVEKVQTTRTLAMQLWVSKDIAQLGWTYKSPILDAYAQPFNTWADMSQLICREDWGDEVRSIAYYCGPLEDAVPHEDAVRVVRDRAKDWLSQYSGQHWPLGCSPDSKTDLDYKYLVDPSGGTGDDRFNAQFFRANVDPSERYVLTVSGSTDYRIRPGESGFDNLFLTGDWTRNGFNAGCIEATVMAGMQCAHAVSGYPPLTDIVGLDHLKPSDV